MMLLPGDRRRPARVWRLPASWRSHVTQGIVAWLAAQVAHQDDGHATRGDETRHARIGAQAPDIVDERARQHPARRAATLAL